MVAVTNVPTSAVPVKVGAVTLVTPSVLILLSEPASSTIVGAFVTVSMVSPCASVTTALVLPALSTDCTV